MTPTRHTYRVQVTLTATVDAADSASAATEVLHELRLRCGECELVVVQVEEAQP